MFQPCFTRQMTSHDIAVDPKFIAERPYALNSWCSSAWRTCLVSAAAFQWICDLKDVLGCCFLLQSAGSVFDKTFNIRGSVVCVFVAVCRSRFRMERYETCLARYFFCRLFVVFSCVVPIFERSAAGLVAGKWFRCLDAWVITMTILILSWSLIQINSVDSNFMAWDFTFCGSDCFKESTLEELR